MESRTLESVFAEVRESDPPASLSLRIAAAIARARRRRAMTRALLESLCSMVSAAALAEAVRYAVNEAYLSGFLDYAHFLATDTRVAAAAWQQFALSLIESLPAISLIFFFAALFALVWSASHALYNVRAYRHAAA